MQPSIPLFDMGRHSEAIAKEVREAIDRVILSGRYILGPECEQFEREFASYTGVTECITVANGTDAIEIGLRALGVNRGDIVVTAANAGNYATIAIEAIGGVPAYVDIDPESHLICLDDLSRVLRENTVRAIVVTHLYGLMHDMSAILGMARQHGVLVFEDCAQSHGAACDGARAGSLGDAAAFSFYPTKNLGALGDGGAVVTVRKDVAENARMLRQYGWSRKYYREYLGGRNSRMDEVQAAVLRLKLSRLDEWNARRRTIASLYRETIKNPRIELPSDMGARHISHLFVVQTDNRADLRTHLSAFGIASEIHYPVPDHQQNGQRKIWSGQLSLPHTERACNRILSLPCYPEMTDAEVIYVAQVLNGW